MGVAAHPPPPTRRCRHRAQVSNPFFTTLCLQAEFLFGKLGTHSKIAGATMRVSPWQRPVHRSLLTGLRPAQRVRACQPPSSFHPSLPSSHQHPSLPLHPCVAPALQLRDPFHNDRCGRKVLVEAPSRAALAAAISALLFQLCHDFKLKTSLRDSKWHYFGEQVRERAGGEFRSWPGGMRREILPFLSSARADT
jgi:hypothetical protein